MIVGVHHVSVTVSDIDKSIAFYRDILGLKLLYPPEESGGKEISKGVRVKGAKMMTAILRAGDDAIELIQYIAPKGKPYDRLPCDIGNMHIAFRVPNINKSYNELKDKGVKFNTLPIEIADGPMKGWLWNYFTDPDGAQLELVEQGR